MHTPPGTPVHVRVMAENGHARLDVRDEGPGLPAEVGDRVFRADSARSRATGGAGLGLSIVSAGAEAHGGRARSESPPGPGAWFVVELPLAPAGAE